MEEISIYELLKIEPASLPLSSRKWVIEKVISKTALKKRKITVYNDTTHFISKFHKRVL